MYSAPPVLTSHDSGIQFGSRLFTKGEFVLINRGFNEVQIDLRSPYFFAHQTFDIFLETNEGSYPFSCYSFSGTFAAGKANLTIMGNDSVTVTMETPLIKFDDSMSLSKLSCYMVNLRNSNIQTRNKSNAIKIVSGADESRIFSSMIE